MTTKSTGILVFFDEEQRSDLIHDRLEDDPAPFSDALSVRDWSIGDRTIALLSFAEGQINYMAIARKGKRVATSKSRIEFSRIIDLKTIPVSSLEEKLDEKIKKYFVKSSRGSGGGIPPATWAAIVAAIKSLRPDLVGEIDRLLALRKYSEVRLRGKAADLLTQEREAIGISLDIFSGGSQLRERVLGGWAPTDSEVSELDEVAMAATLTPVGNGRSSFLKGISQRYIQEESAIQHDLFAWPGMTPAHETGISVFNQGERTLEIVYANRNSLEKTLGVDLIYFNEEYKMFVLVQYKLMHEEGEEFICRPDDQFSKELKRMNEFYLQNSQVAKIENHEEFRLSDDGFMFKLVPQKGLIPASGELIKGMYLTRDYVNFLVGEKGPCGPRGGKKITFENSPRYLTNSQFSSCINSGWVGTRGSQSDVVHELIKNFYESGRAIVVARERVRSSASG